jgi:aminocarboxymuconate-semialdehyde decarboxylase
MARPGFLGVEIGTRVGGAELSDDGFDRFFAVAHELEALVLVHPSDQDLPARTTSTGLGFGAGMPIETALAGAALIGSGALTRRPAVRLCLAHGAGALPALIGRLDKGALIAGMAADSAEMPSRQAQSLWCDSLTYNRQALLAAVELFGAEHVVFGSDYPFPAMPEPIDDIVADLPPDLRRRISRTNAEEHYGPFPRTGAHTLSATRGH